MSKEDQKLEQEAERVEEKSKHEEIEEIAKEEEERKTHTFCPRCDEPHMPKDTFKKGGLETRHDEYVTNRKNKQKK